MGDFIVWPDSQNEYFEDNFPPQGICISCFNIGAKPSDHLSAKEVRVSGGERLHAAVSKGTTYICVMHRHVSNTGHTKIVESA